MVIKCISSLIGIRKVHTLFHTCSVILEVRVWKGERYFLVIHQITQQKHFADMGMSKQFPSSKMKVIISDIIGRNSYLITRPQFLWISGIFCGQAIIQVHWPVSFYGWSSAIDLLQSVFLKKNTPLQYFATLPLSIQLLLLRIIINRINLTATM